MPLAKKAVQSTQKAAVYAQMFPRKMSKGDETKLRIIECGVEFIAKHGSDSLTFESVASALNMHRAHIKYHFAEKDLLIEKCIEFVIATAQQLVIKKLTLKNRWQDEIMAVAEAFFEWVETYPSHGSLLLLFYYRSSFNSQSRALHTTMTEMGFTRIQSILAQGSAGKKLSASELHARSVAIWATIDGMMLYHLTTEASRPSRNFKKIALATIGRLIV
jgi:AcrR family transcriptional regulator